MQPFVPPRSNINKADLIKLRKQQAAESAAKVSTQNGDPNSTFLARASSWIKPEDATDKLRIIFDNSSSMSGKKIEDAKQGVVEFLKNCTPNSTAVAIHLLNSSCYDWSDSHSLPVGIKNATLSSDLVMSASEIVDDSVEARGGTPLYQTIDAALTAAPRATRLVAFSDGEPTDTQLRSHALSFAKSEKIPIDTVFVSDGYRDPDCIRELKLIAEETGGIFLDLSQGDFKTGLKYLAPVKRLLLADASFKGKVERGEVK